MGRKCDKLVLWKTEVSCLILNWRNSNLRKIAFKDTGWKENNIPVFNVIWFPPCMLVSWHELWIFSLYYSFFWLLMPINTYGIASHKRGHNPFLEVYWAFRCDLAILGTNSDTYCEKKAWHVFFILCLSVPLLHSTVVPLHTSLSGSHQVWCFEHSQDS